MSSKHENVCASCSDSVDGTCFLTTSCGHVMHLDCYDAIRKNGIYRCIVCQTEWDTMARMPVPLFVRRSSSAMSSLGGDIRGNAIVLTPIESSDLGTRSQHYAFCDAEALQASISAPVGLS